MIRSEDKFIKKEGRESKIMKKKNKRSKFIFYFKKQRRENK